RHTRFSRDWSSHVCSSDLRPLYLIGSMLFMGMAFMERPVAAMLAPVLGVYLVLLWLLPSFERPRGLHWRNLALFLVPGTLGGIRSEERRVGREWGARGRGE